MNTNEWTAKELAEQAITTEVTASTNAMLHVQGRAFSNGLLQPEHVEPLLNAHARCKRAWEALQARLAMM